MKINVYYWLGTLHTSGTACTYAEAMRLASLNQNAYQPTFFDADTGRELIDDGHGLAYKDEAENNGNHVYFCLADAAPEPTPAEYAISKIGVDVDYALRQLVLAWQAKNHSSALDGIRRATDALERIKKAVDAATK